MLTGIVAQSLSWLLKAVLNAINVCLRHTNDCTSTPVALCRQVKPSEWWDQIPSGACSMHWRSTEGVSLQLKFRTLRAGASGVSPAFTCESACSSHGRPKL